MLKKINLNFSITNIFIILSLLGFILNIFGYFDFFLLSFQEDLRVFLLFFIFTFFHGDIFHFLFNAIILFYFGNIIELNLGKTKYILFFVFTVIFIGFLVKYLSYYYNIIGISGFCMAVLAYYTLDLKDKRNPEYKAGIILIAINILYGLYPGVSFYGHLFGAVAGVIFYYLNKEFFRKKMVGAFAA